MRDVALVPERDVLEPDQRICSHDAREAADPLGRDRVPLVRHRRRPLLATCEWLLDLPYLGAREVPDLGRETVERRGEQRKRGQQLGVAVALEDLRRARRWFESELFARDPLDLRVDRRVLADRPGQLSDPHSGHSPLDPRSVAVESERPPGELQPECRRLGMDAVRAAHAERVPMLLGPVDDGAKRAIEPFENEGPGVLDGEGEGRVEHVGRRQAEVEPAPVLAQRPGNGVDERGDVVVRLPLELGHASGRRRLRHRPDARGGVSGHDAELAPALECRELDLEHPGELRFVRPDLGHGGTGVASDHAVILEGASERRSVTKLVQCCHTLVTHCCPFRR